MADATGDEVGRILYDGFGMVLTNTLPLTLTSALPDAPDAATGLVHLGGGRWYDPALGRPLQPNPTGGPPTMPQALNRYAATPLGQPGVFEAAQSNAFNWTPSAVSFSYGLTTQLAGRYGSLVTGVHHTGYGLIETTGSYSALTRNFRSLPSSVKQLFDEPAFAFVENGRNFYTRRGLIPSANRSLDDLYKATDEIVTSLEDVLPGHGPWSARVSSRITAHTWQIYKRLNQLDNWGSSVARIGAGLDFAVGFGFQLANDYGSPYLTPIQVGFRSITAGSGSAIFGGAGGLIGGLCGPAAVICIPVGAVVGGIVWSEYVQPFIFQASPIYQPADRNLLPMN